VASLELGFSIHHLASVFIATSLHVLIPQISTPLLQVITPKPFDAPGSETDNGQLPAIRLQVVTTPIAIPYLSLQT
jgi:hypothetical protein